MKIENNNEKSQTKKGKGKEEKRKKSYHSPDHTSHVS